MHVFFLPAHIPNFLFCFLRMCFPCRHTCLISFFVSYACVSLTIIHTQIFFSSFMHVFHSIITLNNKNPGDELSRIFEALYCLQAVSLTFYGGIMITTSSRQPPSEWLSYAGKCCLLLPVRQAFPARPPRRPSARRSCLPPPQCAYDVQ